VIFGLGSKRTLILLYFIFSGILNSGYASEYSVFVKNHRKGLMDQRGKELIPPEYDDLGWSDGTDEVIDGVIGYRKGDRWGIINISNTRITNPQYNDLIPYDKHILVASRPDSYQLNSLFGLISLSGKTIIDYKYNSMKKFGENLVVSKKFQNDVFYGMINQKDELVLPFEYISARLIVPEILTLRDRHQLLTLMAQSGEPLFDEKIDEAEILGDKFLVIERNGRKGLTDFKGKTITPIEYQQFFINDNGFLNALPLRYWEQLSDDGEFINSFPYDQVVPVDSGYYKSSRLNYAFVINNSGREIFRIKNSGIRFLNDSLALFHYRNRYGVIHYNGDTIVRPVFDSIAISENRFFMYTRKQNHSGWIMTDLYGMPLSNQEYESIYHLDKFNLAFRKNGFWGIIDCYGAEKIFAKYDSIYTKMNNLYLVDFYGEKGVVDEFGEWKVYPQKGEVFLLKNGNYLISSYFQSRVINRWGDDLFTSENYLWPFNHGFIEEDFENKFGLLNQKFTRLLPVDNSFVAPLVSDSVFLFKNEKGWGLVDISGHILFKNDIRFEQIIGYNEGFIGVKIDGLYGFIDLNGKLRIANRYEGINLFNDGLANIKILGKWGCVNKIEDIVVQPYYDQIDAFENGLAIARKNNRFGILDGNGKHIIEFEYDSIYRIQNGNFICVLNQKFGLINNMGEIMFYPKYDSILDLNNGFVIAERKNKFGVFSSSGVFIIPVLYEKISYDSYNHVFLVSNDPEWEVVLNMNQSKLY